MALCSLRDCFWLGHLDFASSGLAAAGASLTRPGCQGPPDGLAAGQPAVLLALADRKPFISTRVVIMSAECRFPFHTAHWAALLGESPVI